MSNRLTAGRPAFSFAAKIAACALIAVAIASNGSTTVRAAGDFPFERNLLLDVAPMRPLKRVPFINVEADGSAKVELWCRTVPARVQIADTAIRIETAPLPEALPQYMATGQCSEPRMLADNEVLAALAQVTEWRRRGDGVVLIGATEMVFRAASN
jgi:hypothetical protein